MSQLAAFPTEYTRYEERNDIREGTKVSLGQNGACTRREVLAITECLAPEDTGNINHYHGSHIRGE